MDRNQALKDSEFASLYDALKKMHQVLDNAFLDQFNRSLPFSDEILDRWERAKKLGFGEGSSIYDSSYVFGNVKVGMHTWIGPFTIIDGSGGLEIGDRCTVSAGVHIYTHDNIAQTLTGGLAPIDREPVKIGHYTYIGPHSTIRKGVTIGDHCIIGAHTFVNNPVLSNEVVVGNPGRVIGTTVIENGKFRIEYLNSASKKIDQ